MATPTDADREKASSLSGQSAGLIAQALADAREEGRESVGLGDFLPDPCDAETPAPNWNFVETYGDWLDCTLRHDHGGSSHEHEPSGYTWKVR